MTRIVSYACKKCQWGNWGKRIPDNCPHCCGPLHVTGVITEVDLDHAVSALRRTLRSDKDEMALS